ncbi:MAG: PAS domain S-box protein, partial [Methanoregula sp.]|nr:PAS domain S-box protein [Methanoregula sp.]
MAAGKNRPDTPPGERSLREGAEEQLARVPKHSPELKGKTSEQFIHELQVHQIELVTQAEELRRAHLALEESRDKFLDLYDFAPTGYLTLTDKVLIAEVNLAGATLLGVERSKLVNKRFRKFIAPEFLEQWDRYFINVLNHGEKQICTLTLKRGDGSVFPARLEGVRIPGSGGAITVRIAFSDITDIWQIEALRESEERYRTIFDQSPIAIELFDSAGILVHANPACLNLFGIVDIQAIQNFSLFANPNIDDEHKEKLHQKKEKLHQKEPVHYQGPFDFEKVKTLNLYPTSRNGIIWLDVLITPLGSSADSITGFLVQIQDITERKRAEEELRESKALVDTVVENVPLMIFLKEAKDLRFVIFNRAGEELLGYDRKALLGKNNLDLFPPEQAAHFMTKDRDVLDGELNLLDIPEESILTAKKGLRLLHTRKVCIRGADGTTKFLLGISEDITERKKAEETLRETSEYLQKLIEFGNAPIIVWDPDFRITRFNHACEHLTGRTEQEVIGQPLGILFPKKTRATSRALIKKTLAGKR